MSKVFFKLANGNFLQDWSNIGMITAADNWSGVESIVGYKGQGVTSGTAKDPRTISGEGAALNTPFVLANQTSGTISNGGIAEFQLSDPTIGMKGSGSANAPQLVLYMDATGRQDLRFSVDLRDLDGSATNAIQQIAVQYRIGDSGAWLNLPGGYVADATLAGSATMVTHLDLALPAAANNQGQVEIRIITTDSAGTDEFVGLDNLSVVSAPFVVVADTTAPVVASSNPVDGATMVNAGANLVLSFSEPVTLGTGSITITDNAGDSRTIVVTDASQVTLSGQTLTINPQADLKPGATYQVSLDSGSVLDLAGNAYSDSDANPLEFTVTPPLTPIYAIQGASHTSPLAGRSIVTSGVVTAIDTSGTKGYWIQDAAGDGSDATSDAVFVASSTTSAVKVGDLIQLVATVQETTTGVANNLSITQLTNVQNLSVISSGNVIAPTVVGTGGRVVPNAVIESDPGSFNPAVDALDFNESLEGMLVTLKDVQIVGKAGTSTTFAVTDGGANASGMNERGAITRSEGDPNPERIEIFNDTGVLPGLSTNYSVGDRIGDVTGVMSYYNGFYEVLPTVTPGAGQHAVIGRETTALAGDDSHMTVGAYNVDNLAATSAAAKFTQLALDIATNMRAPDMLGLEEIQDNNGSGSGVLASDLTMKALIDAIVAAGGPQYQFVVIDPALANSTGGAFDTNIRNVILYNPARVSYVADSAHLLADPNTADGDTFAGGRKPLVADFLFRGEAVTFVSVHNTERTGSDEPFGHNHPGNAGNDVRRIDQGSAVQQFVQQQLQTNPDARIVVAGDFNGYHFENSVSQLEANGALTNLVRTLPANDRYTSSDEGNNDQLDHVLVSSKLATGAQFDNVHLNTNLAQAGASDRDAVLARVFVNSAPASNGDSPNPALEDGTLVVDAAQGVLANDSDINRDTLTAVLQDGPAHGTLVLAADGSFTYTPVANYHGSDSFTYVARDAFGGVSPVATVQLTVSSVNDAPTLTASSPSAVLVEEGADRAGNFSADVSLQLADVDGATSYDTSDWTFEAEGTYSRAGQFGTAILDTVNNKVYYLLDNRLSATDGLAADAAARDDFSVIITDGITTASVPLSFAITGSNDAPFGRSDSASVAEDGSVSISVLRNDGDGDFDSLTINLAGATSELGASISVVDGQVRYSADADSFDLLAAGQTASDRFVYTVSDGHGGSSGPIAVTVSVLEARDGQVRDGSNKADNYVDAAGRDTTYSGGNGNDSIAGGDGADVLYGENGDDVLDGGSSIDRLDGGNGSDLLFGGAGNDFLTGGNGTDVFVFAAGGGRDTIADFKAQNDKIVLGYAGNGSAASLQAWADASHAASALAFADVDSDGNGQADAVAITGAALGDGAIVLLNWTVADLIGQHLINANNEVIGNWIA